jgi:hemolysin activation/secretion protein
MDYKDFSDRIRLVGSTDVTPIKYLTWSANYAANLSTHSTTSAFNITSTFGLRHLVNSNDDFQYKRYRARGNFFYVRFSAQHERPLLFGTRLFAKLGSQLSSEPLISNEQLSLGGAESVRGYLESEALGDVGLSGALEFRSPQLAPLLGSHWNSAYLFAFVDGGYTRILQSLPSQIDRFDLASWGAGLRLNGFGRTAASLDWAMPRSTGTNTRVGSSRIHFDVTYAF